MATQQPRVAIIGGGLAGSLAALVLRSRNCVPTIFDAGRRSPGGRLLGGRHADSGVQFIKPTEPRVAAIFHMLKNEGLVAEWNGRFGLLGSQGGGFLPASTIASTPIGSMMRDASTGESGSVEFCNFLGDNKSPLYVGTPSNASILPGLCKEANIDVVLGAKVGGLTLEDKRWRLQFEKGDESDAFDAVLLATHDASLASAAVRNAILPIVGDEEEQARTVLSRLADDLQAQRDSRTSAVFTWSGYFARGTSEAVPFDAVTIPASRTIQFLARDASKPGREPLVKIPGDDSNGVGELWTAVSTADFATAMAAQESLAKGESGDSDKGGSAAAMACTILSNEVQGLLTAAAGAPPPLLAAVAKRWGAGFASGTLGLSEECVSLEPWRLAIAGDFLAERASPAEAAALSGLEAGERIAAMFESE